MHHRVVVLVSAVLVSFAGFVAAAHQPASPPPAPPAEQTAATWTEEDVSARIDGIRDRIETVIETQHGVAFGIGVVAGDVQYATGVGARVLDGPAADGDTLFAIGSITKTLTAAGVAHLVDRGDVAWDSRVADVFPKLRFKDPEATENATVGTLLSHSSGVRRTDMQWYLGTPTRQEIYDAFARSEPKNDFGAGFNYQNICFVAAGEMSAAIAGADTWEEYIDNVFLTPLAMNRANFTVAEHQADANHARGYRWDPVTDSHAEVTMFDIPNAAPAGALNASANEMTRWISLFLNDGVHDGTTIVSKESIDAMWTRRNAMSPVFGYGYGWILQPRGESRTVGHDGAIDGFHSSMLMMPDEDIGVIVLANSNAGAGASTVASMVLDALLADASDDQTLAEVDPNIALYAGTYEAPMFGKAIAVTLQNGDLFIEIPGQGVFQLSKPHDDGRRHLLVNPQLEWEFRFDDEDTLTHLVLHQQGLKFEYPRTGVAITPPVPIAELAPYLGVYDAGAFKLTVLVQNQRLAIDVPTETTYELLAPEAGFGVDNDNDVWTFAPTDRLTVRFVHDDEDPGDISSLELRGGARPVVATRVETSDEPLPAVADVMKQVHDAIGAGDWDWSRGMKVVGAVEVPQQGLTGTITTVMRGLSESRVSIDFGVYGSIETGQDGDTGWTKFARSPDVIQSDKTQLETSVVSNPLSLAGDWESVFESVVIHSVTAGTDEVPSRIRVDVTMPQGTTASYWIDRRSGFPMKSSVTGAFGGPDSVLTMETEWTEWAAGIPIPGLVTIADHPGFGPISMRYDPPQPVDLGDKAFAPPSQ